MQLFKFLKFHVSLKVISLIVILSCIAGFIIQIKEICIQYFAYSTATKTTLSMPEILPTPSLVYCPRYNDVLDRRNATAYGILPYQPVSVKDIVGEYGKLTIREIFKLSPSTSEVMDHCVHRKGKINQIEVIDDKKRCYDIFKVRKYFMQEFICYEFTSTKLKTYEPLLYAHSPMFVSTIYRINIDHVFDNCSYMMFIVYVADNDVKNPMPLTSRFYGAELDLPIHKLKKHRSFLFRVTYQIINIKLMEAPYDTNCVYQNGVDSCARNCLIAKFLQLQRVPNSEIIDDPMDLKPFDPAQLDDPLVEEQIVAFRNECKSQCRHPYCVDEFTQTYVVEIAKESDDFRSWIHVSIPQSHTISIESTPQVDLYQFLIYISSCFGIWFGLSFMSLHPSNLKKIAKRKQSTLTPTHKCFYQHHYCKSIENAQRQRERRQRTK